MEHEISLLTDWPGKSASVTGTVDHPALYHMLDVAAVAECLLERANLPPEHRAGFAALIALHDLGKISRSFRSMLRAGKPQSLSHWELTHGFLAHTGPLAEQLRSHLDLSFGTAAALIAAVAGHHGRPFSCPQSAVKRALRHEARAEAEEAMRALLDLWPEASFEGMGEESAVRLSWWLSGLTVVADWVGSNSDWFPAVEPNLSLQEYLDQTRDRAASAVAASGLMPAKASSCHGIHFASPRPMQVVAEQVELSGEPTLAIIEDETGTGKTEAALILAHRMMQQGLGTGLFFALPTMATADAMFDRVLATGGTLLDHPSVALAHGRAALSRSFREVQGRTAQDHEVTCAPWLADGRRKALLADIGIGTIDQALLGVLRSRFSTLRLWGLAGKITIVDEVHEMGDPYVARLLEGLLEYLGLSGSSVILMTATLPLDLRQRLIASYRKGQGRLSACAESAAYPALTLSSTHLVQHPVPACPSHKPPVKVKRCASAAEVVDLLCDAAGRGAACVWVRNAVDDAISAVDALARRGVDAKLLHARYALCDRKTHEADLLRRFGKTDGGRSGQVVVATQVVESSLDLDFDVMISDLAPVSALIQRAGRLWRHARDRRPVSEPELTILSPDPDAVHAGWLREELPSGSWVYPRGLCWRSAVELFGQGRIASTDGLRAQIERVHGSDTVPDALRDDADTRAMEDIQKRSIGHLQAVDWTRGYGGNADGYRDDEITPTRLGRPQKVLALARNGPDGLRPWADASGLEGWMLSEVQASAARLGALALPDQSAPAIAAIKSGWPKWKAASVTVCPVGPDGMICEGLRYDAGRGLTWETLDKPEV